MPLSSTLEKKETISTDPSDINEEVGGIGSNIKKRAQNTMVTFWILEIIVCKSKSCPVSIFFVQFLLNIYAMERLSGYYGTCTEYRSRRSTIDDVKRKKTKIRNAHFNSHLFVVYTTNIL